MTTPNDCFPTTDRLSSEATHESINEPHRDSTYEPTKEERQAFEVIAQECAEGHERLWTLSNPEEFEEAGRRIFGGPSHAQDLLDKFDRYQLTYDEIFPDLFPWQLRIAEAAFRSGIRTPLDAFVLVPKTLSAASKPLRVRVGGKLLGGGGMTGHPYTSLWQCRDYYEYVLERGDTIIVSTTMPYVLEAPPDQVDESVASFVTFLFTKLEPLLQETHPHLSIAWDHISLFGVSYGCTLTEKIYKNVCQREKEWPSHDLCITHSVSRSPLFGQYHRHEPGFADYIGHQISHERACEAAEEIRAVKKQLAFGVYRAGSFPPIRMWPAHATSRANIWREFAGPYSALDEIKNGPEMIMPTKRLLLHGAADTHVGVHEAFEAAQLFVEKGCKDVTLVVIVGKGHASDYEEPLTPQIRDFLNTSISMEAREVRVVYR